MDEQARHAVAAEADAARQAVDRMVAHLDDPLVIWQALLDVRHRLAVVEEVLLDAGHAPSA